ncbi:hypothetical protein [Streptomyces spectabilis]|uniref:Uncharacterized protein n=1 Tax=Streptomyces spectabilis TaxID=68270 RepID=A0A5P2XMA9_STRST|nr:hypothetical protein [Streptomyces spectabilis]MBB5105580.1 hypothetical protein [Streptomyces spectabilis]MCI3906766.1 hypothetical protein [Streptomyces spectabilis]QEV63572.1 hypothetical protein CP982_36750 [Streptomyces spectabilis]GGV22527.1 hypothetical protein GCM10010245_37840 [Streptomyces spectabilis]
MAAASAGTRVGEVAASEVVAASAARGRELLRRRDAFVAQLSPFDRQARLCLRHDVLDATVEGYLDYVGNQVVDWSDDELAALKHIVAEIDGLFGGWSFQLPQTVLLVKTSGQEEGRAAYTRGEDTIVVPAGKAETLRMPSPDSDPLYSAQNTRSLRDLLVHEFFHLISKNNRDLRARLYDLIGYTLMSTPVQVPSVPWPEATSPTAMPDLRITNPDTPLLDVRIRLNVPKGPYAGPAQDLVPRDLVPVLMAAGPYAGGSFFGYLRWYFLAVEDQGGGRWAPVTGDDGRPLTYLMPDRPDDDRALWDQYLEKVGRNATSELFHPDEIIAQNVVFAALLPTPGLLTGIGGVLSR